jgi:membrane-bound serine protease (ClpP class)
VLHPWLSSPQAVQPAPTLNLWLILGMTVGVGAFFVFGIAAGLKAQRRPVAVGRETLIGQTGFARDALAPTGTIRMEGEEWTAQSVTGEEIPAGAAIRVVGLVGLRLQVERDWGAARWSERAPWPPDSSE